MNLDLAVAIRVDASIDIGSGHVQRMLTLAKALSSLGISCHFVCRRHNGNLIEYIRELGFECTELPKVDTRQSLNGYESWLGCSEKEDAIATLNVLDNVDAIIVDHYSLGQEWHNYLRGTVSKIIAVDDLANRPLNVDMLLDQTYGRMKTDYSNLVPEICNIICGAQWALLRPEFSTVRKECKQSRINRGRLLLNLGGVDKDNDTQRLVNALVKSDVQLKQLTVVVGSLYPHISALEDSIAKHDSGYKIRILSGVNNMAQLMSQHDMAIGAAGSTTWERCCLGLPTVLVVVADNQLTIAQELDSSNLVLAGGDLRRPNQEAVVISKVEELFHENTYRDLSQNSFTIVDGLGAIKVAGEISKLLI